MECEHKNGWVMCEGNCPVIHTDQTNDNLVAEFVCNTLNCKQKKTIKFDMVIHND